MKFILLILCLTISLSASPLEASVYSDQKEINQLRLNSASNQHPILLQETPQESVFRSGDIIAFSLRKGRTPKFVQTITQSPFDHVGILIWEDRTLFLYEFLLGKGVFKTPFKSRISDYTDDSGKVHFIVSSAGFENQPLKLTAIKNFLDKTVLANDGQISSCTDLVIKALKNINSEVPINTQELKALRQQVDKYRPMLNSYNHMDLDRIIPPVTLISALKPIFGTITQLHWTISDFLLAWKLTDLNFLHEPKKNPENSCKIFYKGTI